MVQLIVAFMVFLLADVLGNQSPITEFSVRVMLNLMTDIQVDIFGLGKLILTNVQVATKT